MHSTHGALVKGMAIVMLVVIAILGIWVVLTGGNWEEAINVGIKIVTILGIATLTVWVISVIQHK